MLVLIGAFYTKIWISASGIYGAIASIMHQSPQLSLYGFFLLKAEKTAKSGSLLRAAIRQALSRLRKRRPLTLAAANGGLVLEDH
jgi:hypothetical protein